MDKNTTTKKTSNNITDILANASKSLIKVRDNNGKFNVVTPLTKIESVLDTNGKSLDKYLREIKSSVADSQNQINTLQSDTEYLTELYVELKDDYVDPTISKLDQHLETFNDDEENMFDFLYDEIDNVTSSVGEIQKTMGELASLITKMNDKLDMSVQQQKKLSDKLDGINEILSEHVTEEYLD